MNKILESLVKLQKVDLRLIEIDELKGGLPETVQDQEVELLSINKKNEENKERVKEIDSESRKINGDIEDSSTKLAKYKEQLYLVKSNKEYDAITKEIDQMKEQVSNFEDSVIRFEEEKINLDESIKLLNNKIEDISTSLGQNKIFLENAMKETKTEEANLRNNRINMLEDIEKKYYGDYEKIRGAHEGIGVVNISRDACGNCFSQLPPQIVIEIKTNKNIVNCQNCSSFLYWEEE